MIINFWLNHLRLVNLQFSSEQWWLSTVNIGWWRLTSSTPIYSWVAWHGNHLFPHHSGCRSLYHQENVQGKGFTITISGWPLIFDLILIIFGCWLTSSCYRNRDYCDCSEQYSLGTTAAHSPSISRHEYWGFSWKQSLRGWSFFHLWDYYYSCFYHPSSPFFSSLKTAGGRPKLIIDSLPR